MRSIRVNRRRFVRGALGMAGLGAASLLGCRPGAPVSPTSPGAGAAPTAVPTALPVAAEPTLRYADKACVFRYMTGGVVQAGPDDKLVQEIQEEALRKVFGLNVKVEFESASWTDFDGLVEMRLQTQGCDGVQRYPTLVNKWLSTQGLMQDIDEVVRTYGQNLLEMIPKAAWDYFANADGKYMGIPSMYTTPSDIEFTHIRRDWCDKIDRDVPTTYEELEECLRLFKQKNLGGDVTIPFTVPSGWYIGWQIYGPWTPEPEVQMRWIDEGKPIFLGTVMDEERLDMLQRWFKDGLLNNEWGAWSEDQTYDAIAKGIVGCIQDGWWLMNGQLQNVIMKNDRTRARGAPAVGRGSRAGRTLGASPAGTISPSSGPS